MKDTATKSTPVASYKTFDLSSTVDRVESFLSSQGVVFDDTQEPMFRNHIDALKRRIETGEFTFRPTPPYATRLMYWNGWGSGTFR